MRNDFSLKVEGGFTLVELAIALMVIGLLIGGVLKGQELIENARVTATMRQLKAYDAATLIFRSGYGALPGDFKRPNRIPNCDAELCNQPGNGNGRVFGTDTTPNEIEVYNFFPHLVKAGMLKGGEGGTRAEMEANVSIDTEETYKFFPPMPLDALYTFRVQFIDGYDGDRIPAGHYYWGTMEAKKVSALDSKLDDGNPRRGEVQIASANECFDEDDADLYSMLADKCDYYIQVGF